MTQGDPRAVLLLLLPEVPPESRIKQELLPSTHFFNLLPTPSIYQRGLKKM
jgi:hypothetical protein